MNNTPITPNSSEEWELELEVFGHINNNAEITEDVKITLRKMWREIVLRESWYFELKGLK